MKPLHFLAALALVGTSVRAQNTLDDYPNAPPGFILPIASDGATANGRINYTEDRDVFSFQVGSNGGVRIYTTGTTDTNGVLRRASNSSASGWTTIVSEEGGTGNFSITRTLEPGLYSIQVGGKLAADPVAGTIGGAYTLRVEFTPPVPPEPGDIDLPEVPAGSALDFGEQTINTATPKTVTMRNTGAGNLQITGITLAASNTAGGGLVGTAGPFFIESGAARTIAPGASSTFRVVFRPGVAGNFTGTVIVSSNDPDENPWRFTVTGTGKSGTPPPPPGKPEIGLTLGDADLPSGGTVDFGEIALPAAVVTVRELIITNTGDGNLNLGNVTISELPLGSPLPSAPPGFFRVLSPPAPVVEPGRSTVLRIGAGLTSAFNFAPQPRFSAQATIANNDEDENPYRLLLTAEIQTAPPPAAGEITVFAGETELSSEDTLDFGTTPTGTPVEKRVTIKNTGESDLRLSSIAVEWAGPIIAIWPPPPPPFRVEGVEPRTVAPGASTSCRVIFPAAWAGPAEARLKISSSDADENPFVIHLKAVAEGEPPPPQAPEIAVSLGNQDLPMGATVDFGRTSLTVPVKKEITVSNQGPALLTVRSAILPAGRTPIPADAAGVLDPAPGVILAPPFRFSGEAVTKVEPGASKVLSVIFQPRSNGTFEAMLCMSNNDRDENPYKLKLTGTGGTDPAAEPDIALSLGDRDLPQGGVVDFGEAAPGTSVTKEIRITNSGRGDLLLGRISFSSPVNVDPAIGVIGADANGLVILPPVGALPFRALPPPNNLVPAGRSAILRVVFMASPSGSHAAVLSIESNDPDESPWRLNLRGKSTGDAPARPEISVSAGDAELPIGGTLDFGVVATGSTVRREIKVTNSGSGELRISSFTILPAEFMANDALIWTPPNALVRVVSGPGIIGAGEAGIFVLEMLTFTDGPARLLARIGNNDADENPYAFAITATILSPPVIEPPFIGPPLIDPDGVLR
jgi:hypothetical protein